MLLDFLFEMKLSFEKRLGFFFIRSFQFYLTVTKTPVSHALFKGTFDVATFIASLKI